MKYETGSAFFAEQSPKDVERFVEKNFDISEQVTYWLERKGMSQKDLADAVGKTPSEISRWLAGTHNLTLRSIAKMETALGEDIILTPLKASAKAPQTHFVYIHSVVERLNNVIQQDLKFANWHSGTSEVEEPTQVEAA